MLGWHFPLKEESSIRLSVFKAQGPHLRKEPPPPLEKTLYITDQLALHKLGANVNLDENMLSIIACVFCVL